MSYFQRIIKRSRKTILAEGQGSDPLASSHDDAQRVDTTDEQEASQHRVKQPAMKAVEVVDRTSDLSIVKNGEWIPVLELEQGNDSNEGMSNQYMGNRYVNSGILTHKDTSDSQHRPSRSGSLERRRSPENSAIQIRDPQPDKAQKIERESEQVELNAGEETGLPRGNRTGSVADIISEKEEEPSGVANLKHPDEPEPYRRRPACPAGPEPYRGRPACPAEPEPYRRRPACPAEQTVATPPEPIDELDPDQLLFRPAKNHPEIPDGVAQALQKVQAGFAKPTQSKRTTDHPPEKRSETAPVSIGRVSVKLRMAEKAAATAKPSPTFSAKRLTSRYFMGDA